MDDSQKHKVQKHKECSAITDLGSSIVLHKVEMGM